MDLQFFRDIFRYNLYLDHETKHLEHFHHLLYDVPLALRREDIAAKTPEQYMKQLKQKWTHYYPEQFYQMGKQRERASRLGRLSEFAPSEKIFVDSLKHYPLTLVIVPGFFNEFINNIPFHEFFQKDVQEKSSFFKFCQQAFDQANERNEELAFEWHDSLYHTKLDGDEIGRVKVGLQDLFEFSGGSIGKDSTTSKSDHFNIILIKQPLLSLESVGDLKRMARQYLRRLEKLFMVLGFQPQHLVFIGYSRGAAITLEMIDQAQKKNWPFLPAIRSMVSLGGVIYGTPIADQTFRWMEEETDITNQTQLSILMYHASLLAQSLQYVGQKCGQTPSERYLQAIKRPNIVAQNMLHWTKFLYSLNKVGGLGPKLTQKDLKELMTLGPTKIVKKVHDIISSMTVQKQKLSGPDPRGPINLILSIGLKGFNLMGFYTEYDLNIKKFKTAVKKVIEAGYQLSTKQRFEWWKSSSLPTQNVFYFGLTGVMTDPQRNDLAWEMMNNSVTYAPGSVDDQFLIETQKSMEVFESQGPNDSQVNLYQSYFNSQLNSLLNERYSEQPLLSSWLGVMGTHHWGFAIPVAAEMVDGTVNPFPRMTLLKSIACLVALKLKDKDDNTTPSHKV